MESSVSLQEALKLRRSRALITLKSLLNFHKNKIENPQIHLKEVGAKG